VLRKNVFFGVCARLFLFFGKSCLLPKTLFFVCVLFLIIPFFLAFFQKCGFGVCVCFFEHFHGRTIFGSSGRKKEFFCRSGWKLDKVWVVGVGGNVLAFYETSSGWVNRVRQNETEKEAGM